LQDWRGWMQEGILDTNIPMNYKREYCTVTGPGCFGNQQAWYTDWNEFAKDNQYARSTTIGAAIYLNTVDGSVVQVRKALAPSAAGNAASAGSATRTGRRIAAPIRRAIHRC